MLWRLCAVWRTRSYRERVTVLCEHCHIVPVGSTVRPSPGQLKDQLRSVLQRLHVRSFHDLRVHVSEDGDEQVELCQVPRKLNSRNRAHASHAALGASSSVASKWISTRRLHRWISATGEVERRPVAFPVVPRANRVAHKGRLPKQQRTMGMLEPLHGPGGPVPEVPVVAELH